MTNWLVRIGNWFLGKAEEVEQLDSAMKAIVNQQTKRAFYLGAGVGIVVTAGLVRLLG
ncbi:hypothetical protein [Propionispora hippei]|uniref:Uncharacterized protein n=1 Tax=Propionispora hippei DSM 15287 TaxID=1123003 RepID=A0A1M6P360_9FIRM|nr:hypothetical protein [Propionispora hippei]SHK02333.1 hypothetical protein SAMN02745170_03944 [Propionispora hippei DSM 15287]